MRVGIVLKPHIVSLLVEFYEVAVAGFDIDNLEICQSVAPLVDYHIVVEHLKIFNIDILAMLFENSETFWVVGFGGHYAEIFTKFVGSQPETSRAMIHVILSALFAFF